MRVPFVMLGVLAGLAACSTTPFPTGRQPARVVVVNNDRPMGPRTVGRVPPGHYPPPGQCRLWYAGRPPGKQPSPGRCEALIGAVPRGAFVLYNAKSWDTNYDWNGHARHHPGTVPEMVLRIMARVDR